MNTKPNFTELTDAELDEVAGGCDPDGVIIHETLPPGPCVSDPDGVIIHE